MCAQNKGSNQVMSGLVLGHTNPRTVTGLPISKGNTAILTVVDRFSKMAHFLPLPKILSAKDTAEVLLNQVFKLHG